MEFSQKELMGSLSGTKIFKFPSLSLVDLLTAAEKMEHEQATILEARASSSLRLSRTGIG
jgi:hypothetical protein